MGKAIGITFGGSLEVAPRRRYSLPVAQSRQDVFYQINQRQAARHHLDSRLPILIPILIYLIIVVVDKTGSMMPGTLTVDSLRPLFRHRNLDRKRIEGREALR